MGIEFLFLIDFIILFFQPHRWNFFATLATGYLGFMVSEKDGSIFMLNLQECSKRIYEMPNFIFYALGYAIKKVLSMTRSGINSYISLTAKSQKSKSA